MSSYNCVILMGYLTRDPEVRYMPSGNAVANFGLAINRKYTSKDGEKKEEVDFFDIEAWNKTAELCGEYLHKGSGVLIEGRLKQERWEQDGKQRSRIKIVATVIQFLPKGSNDDSRDDNNDAGGGYQEQRQQQSGGSPPF